MPIALRARNVIALAEAFILLQKKMAAICQGIFCLSTFMARRHAHDNTAHHHTADFGSIWTGPPKRFKMNPLQRVCKTVLQEF
jgi:hypothetical protein